MVKGKGESITNECSVDPALVNPIRYYVFTVTALNVRIELT